MKHTKSAFTLAEILITLAVIGVVAALTIPSVIIANNDRALVAQTKKAYNTISKAYQQFMLLDSSATAKLSYTSGLGDDLILTNKMNDMIASNQKNSLGLLAQAILNAIMPPAYAMEAGGGSSNNILTHLAPYLNVANACDTQNGERNCSSSVGYGYKNGNTIGNIPYDYSLFLADGTALGAQSGRPMLFADVNGDDGPNVLGKDLHGFVFDYNGTSVYPMAATGDDCNDSNPGSYSCTYCAVYKNSLECTIPDGVDMSGRGVGDTSPMVGADTSGSTCTGGC